MTADQLTDLKDGLRTALEQQADDEELLTIVRKHYAAGGTKSEAYSALQDIWEGYGYAELEDDETDSKRGTLEYVMERVWYWGD